MVRDAHGEPRCGASSHGSQQQVKALSIALGILAFVLSAGFMHVIPSASAQSTCDYYASPNGTGNGRTLSKPFQISRFWSLAAPGKTLCLLDGIYTGDSSMIEPPENLSGVAGRPITIKALNDGKVTINGQGRRKPVLLYRNNYFVLEGFNAHNSSDEVIRVLRSHHNVVKRVAAWDAVDGNQGIIGAGSSEYTLWEDVAAWGIGRKVFHSSQGGNFTTCRRCWGRWEGSHHIGPKFTYTLAYNNSNMIIENSLGTWSGEKMQKNYTLQCAHDMTYRLCGTSMNDYTVDQPEAIFGVDRLDGSDKNARSKILGSIAYITRNDKFPAGHLYMAMNMDSIEYRDNVAYIEPGSYSDVMTFNLFKSKYGAQNILATALTSIGGAGYYIAPQWKSSHIFHGTVLPMLANIFTSPTYARICKRYQDGNLTNEPLWPWPMNQRIKDAMVQSGRAPVDVTQTIEQMFGPIPEECKTSIPSTTVAPAPRNSHIISAP